jgi:hypothetical protein
MMVETGGLCYSEYLQLDKILAAQECQSEVHGEHFCRDRVSSKQTK